MRLACGKILIAILLAVAFSACGGGGGGGADSNLPVRTLSWVPPARYADDSVIVNPILELSEYWIYIKSEHAIFTPADDHVQVYAVNPATNQPVTSFDLRLAAPALSLKQGIRYYVSMRTVSTDGVPSGFSDPPAEFMF
jgi:hypothetical protein